jgi:formyl-CoA transferase
MVQRVDHPVAGPVRFVARPSASTTCHPHRRRRRQCSGSTTAEVLSEWLGWTAEQMTSSAARGAFGKSEARERGAE